MAEYYAVLKRAVAGLDPTMAEARRTVYDKARNALIGQLKAIDPPLPTSEISRQRLELEEAIRKVERESAASVQASVPARRQAPPPPEPQAEPEYEPEPAPAPASSRQVAASPPPEPADDASSQDVFRRAIQEAEARGAAAAMRAPRKPTPVRAESVPMSEMTPDMEPPRPRVERLPRAEPAPIPETDYEEEPEDNGRGPRLAPDYDYDWEEPAPPQPPPKGPQRQAPPMAPPPRAERADFDRGDDMDLDDREERPPRGKRRQLRRERDYLDEDDRDLMASAGRPSRLPAILLIVLLLAVLGGLGALAWSQRAIIVDILSTFNSSSTSSTSMPAADDSATPPAPATPTKDTDRLLPDDSGNRNVRVIDGPTPPTPETSAPSSDVPVPVPVPVPTPAPAPSAAPTTGMTSSPDDTALVAQKAILYEEPLNGSGGANAVTSANAAVTWSYVESGANGPEVRANIDIPDRKMKVRVSFRRNTDKSLPASHLVEIVIDTPADFPGKGVRSVPRLVLKQNEGARGQPLIGASAKVAEGFFWIALSSTDTDVTKNLNLMRTQSWFDLPMVYETGQRAILTFEKGTPGARVFAKALAAWTTS